MNTISIALPLTDWQTVINVLAQQPYQAVAPLITQIVQQIQAAQSNPQASLPLNNGEENEQGLLERREGRSGREYPRS
jgi:hypothetical protein